MSTSTKNALVKKTKSSFHNENDTTQKKGKNNTKTTKQFFLQYEKIRRMPKNSIYRMPLVGYLAAKSDPYTGQRGAALCKVKICRKK